MREYDKDIAPEVENHKTLFFQRKWLVNGNHLFGPGEFSLATGFLNVGTVDILSQIVLYGGNLYFVGWLAALLVSSY